MAATAQTRCVFGPPDSCGDPTVPKVKCTPAQAAVVESDVHSDSGARFKTTCYPFTTMRGVVTSTNHCFEGGAYLPVVRYGHPGGGGGYAGPTGALPADEKFKKVCGRYYYFEPDSGMLMYLGRVGIFGSKIHAFVYMFTTLMMGYSRVKDGYKKLSEAFSGSYEQSDLLTTYKGAIDLTKHLIAGAVDTAHIGKYFASFEPWATFQRDYPNISGQTYWQWHASVYNTPNDDATFADVGGASNMWDTRDEVNPGYKGWPGQYDQLDQFLCRMAQFMGLDTVIFQHEPEPDWTATEILSVRENEDYLCGPMKVPLPPPRTSVAGLHSRHWFKSYGFVYIKGTATYWSANKHSWWDPVFSPPGNNRGHAGGIVVMDRDVEAERPVYDAIDASASRPAIARTRERIGGLRLVLPTEKVMRGMLSFVYEPTVFVPLWDALKAMADDKYA